MMKKTNIFSFFLFPKTVNMQRDVFLLSVVLLYCIIFLMLHSHLKRINNPITQNFIAKLQENGNSVKTTRAPTEWVLVAEQAESLQQLQQLFPKKINELQQHQYKERFIIKRNYSEANIRIPQSVKPKLENISDSKANCSKCKKLPHSGSFQNVSGIFVLTTFYDQRIPSKHRIRILVVQDAKDNRKLVCWFKNGTYLVQSRATKYEMCENHGRKFGGWIYSCLVPKGMASIKVVYLSLHTNNILAPLTKMDLISLTKKETKKLFGLCVPPLFGSVGMTKLVQFLELNRILGASHFHFYLHNASSSVRVILNHYAKLNLATLFEWELPSVITNSNIWYHGQLLAIQDCLYRNMANFQFLLFSDLDEFVIPRKTYTWPRLVNYLKDLNKNQTSENSLGFSFKSAFFDPWQTPDVSQQLSYFQRLHRSKSISNIRTKVMVQPDKVFELGIHHVSKPIFENLTITNVNPEIAMIHHYQPCMVRYEPKMQCSPKIRDATILKYTKQLQNNYNQRVKELFKDFL